ncbi:hypothetical protein CHUAL_012691 [Chamberlinius hualienensis]
MAELLWKECADWLVRCNVLPVDHRVRSRTAQVIDLANTLRDGVLLCHLLNNLIPGCVDLKEINLRPQMSQFLCVKNIRAFLQSCQKVFELKPVDLFDPHMLFDFTDFGRVLRTLSKLSNSSKALSSGTRGFPSYGRTPEHDYYNDDIYRNMEDLANDNEEDIYDYEVMGFRPDDGDECIYEDLCAVRKRGSEPPVPQAPVDKRDFCVRELVMTENNYIEVLNRIISHFMRPLKNSIKPDDFRFVFLKIKELAETHTGFFSDLNKATSAGTSFSDKLCDCFLHWKEKFVIYGEYCSNLPRAQEMVDEICRKNEAINQQVLRCQMEYNEGKFKLRDLLSVPMQRILKYHLFLAELKKNTPDTHDDYPGLERALESMLDISQYINEVKRDNETLQLISEIQNHITDFPMSEDVDLKDYGRLLRDGELKIKSHCDSGKTKIRYVFLFDRGILMCKSTRMMDKLMGGELYSYKEFLNLADFKIEEPGQNLKLTGKDKWTHLWYLAHRHNKTAYTMWAKTDDTKNKWIESFRTAIDNNAPKEASFTDHLLTMSTFNRPTNCHCCQKLLRGVFYQGYKCITCEVPVHKECIKTLRSCGAPRLPPRPSHNGNVPESQTVVKAKLSYRTSTPGHLSFEPDDIIYVISKSNSAFWEGCLRRTDQRGFFPYDHVEELSSARQPYVDGVNAGGTPKSPSSSTLPISRTNARLIAEEYPWFAGVMDHDSANRCLERLPDGSFLVRISEKQDGRYVISLKHESKVKHMRVNHRGDEEYWLSELKFFKSIVELVKWHEDNSLADFFQGLETTLRHPFRPTVSYVEPIGCAVANYDFSATSNSMLSLKKGDVVTILSKRGGDKGWWKGQLDNRVSRQSII